jgi:hypothetical protein
MSTTTVANINRNPWTEELERVFEEYYSLVYRTAYSLTGSARDAEDVLQTVFLRLLGREIPPSWTEAGSDDGHHGSSEHRALEPPTEN